MSIMDRVREFDGQIFAASKEVRMQEGEHARLEIALREAQERLNHYHRAQATGNAGPPDEALEDRLIGELSRIRGRIDPNLPEGARDIQAATKAAAFRRQAEGLRSSRAEFIQRHAATIEEALLVDATAARDALYAALAGLDSAASAWDASAAGWRAVGEPLGYQSGELTLPNPISDGVASVRFRLAQKNDMPAPPRAVGTSDEIVVDLRSGQPVGA